MITGAGRGFSSGADLKAGFDPTPDGRARRLHDAHPALPPDHASASARCPSRCVAAVNGAAVGHRLLARDLLRPDRRGGVGLFPARVREHRPGARRRVLALHTRARRPRAGRRDGHARRAHPGRHGAGVGPDQPGRIPTTVFEREADALLDRLAAGPTRSYAGSQAPAQPLDLRRHGGAARARGDDPAGDGGLGRLRRGRRWPSSRSARPASPAAEGEACPAGRTGGRAGAETCASGRP